MERLTIIDGCGNDELARCMNCGLGKAGENLENCGMCEEGWQRALRRLAAYEDTGLEPDVCSNYRKFEDEAISKGVTFKRIVELMNADHDGRLVVLPCKVGDSVYIPDLDKKIPVKVRVQGISISVSGRTILHFGGYPVECAWGDGCVKDWFLTREESEAALAPKGGEG